MWRELDLLEESYVKFSEGKCAAKSSKPSRKPRRGQDMPVCNSKSFALQWLIHWMDGSQYRRVLMKSMFTTIMPEVVFEVTKPTYISLMKRLCSSDAWKRRRKARMRLSTPSWSGICGPNRDLLVLKWWIYQHIWLQPALAIELSPYWLFYAKWDALQGFLPNPMCNSKRPKESGKLKSRLVRSRNTGGNLWERERKVLRRKHVEGEGQTYEPDTFWAQFLWAIGVFLNLKLCAFWRSAAHSVHDNFLTIHCGPIKVYIFEVCEVTASAWIKWVSRKLSFSTTYPSQKKVHKCFV